VKPAGLIAGSAFTAILLGLAAQQTLGNLSARLVLVSPRPFRVGECIRLQAGALGGVPEGVVSSLGLMYTLARGEDRITISNNGVPSAVVVPVRAGDPRRRRPGEHAIVEIRRRRSDDGAPRRSG